MNILYINHYAGNLQMGMEYRPFLMAREWVRLGHSVTIVAASFAHTRSVQAPERDTVSEMNVEGVRYVFLPTPSYQGNGVARVKNIFTFVARLFGLATHLGDWRPDAVIASSTYPIDIYPARRLAKRYGAKLVWEVHDLWPLSPMELGGMAWWHPFIWLMQRGENAACRAAQKVVCMLPKAQVHLEAHGMAAAKFVYIPNGIVAADWVPALRSAPPPAILDWMAAQHARGYQVLVYAGAHGVANALPDLIAAMALLKDLPLALLMLGQGPEKPALQAQAANLGLAHLYFADAIPKTAVPTVLEAADILYIGWQRQAIYRFGINPNKLMDYMLAAKPILHAVEAGNDPVQAAGCGVSVPPANPEAIAQGLRQLHALTAAEKSALGARGKAFVLAHHDYPILSSKFLDALI